MKTSILSKSILVLAVMFLCNLAMSAASPREYMYDTKEAVSYTHLTLPTT